VSLLKNRKLETMENHANLSCAALSSQAGLGGLIGESLPMQHLYELIRKIHRDRKRTGGALHSLHRIAL
jgi:hypothetical protein